MTKKNRKQTTLIFVYGTLTRPNMTPAVLDNHVLMKETSKFPYKHIMKCEGQQVNGKVFTANNWELGSIDYYEGVDADFYERRPVEVWVLGQKVPAHAYFLTKNSLVRFTNLKLCPKCGRNLAAKPHTCPYEEDINDDHETKCNCCPECEQNCIDEI